MKTNSATGCLRERNGLRVCRKSSMISKSPLSQARVSQNSEEVATVINNDQAGVGQPQSGVLVVIEPLTVNFCFNKTQRLEVVTISLCHSSSSKSSEHQDFNLSDFYISDKIFSGLPIDRNLTYDNNVDSIFLPDYKCEESNVFCDLAEDYMVLPLLENTLETRYDHDGKSSGETIGDVKDSSLYLAIHQLRSSNQDTDINIYPNYDPADCFDPQVYIRNLPDQLDATSTLPNTNVPKEKQKAKQITLVLDLDETLVHSTLEFCSDADFTFPVFFNMKEHIVYVKHRPHLRMFLERVAEMFEMVVFTASQSIYAKQLLDILDPDGKLISKRAYRESCIFAEGSYMKDLTVLGVDLAKVAIIDNSPQVFSLQVNNGIPIKSWFDDPADTALISLLPFLETLVDANDVRPIIARKFGNKE
ncbi:unnamed protein product [Fraxinus pennsylvanica]|uniref:FCP1 homology domain-containing protein n=1 Tax=Fraxinus pennsylvanica TaxID=56036 RepID=A0AAD2E144_9LAMI|nr:unnamed protein product [Fraxinus pennsylvanica]